MLSNQRCQKDIDGIDCENIAYQSVRSQGLRNVRHQRSLNVIRFEYGSERKTLRGFPVKTLLVDPLGLRNVQHQRCQESYILLVAVKYHYS